MIERNLGLFAIVTNYPDEDKIYRKELMVYANPDIYTLESNNFSELCKYLEDNQGYNLINKRVTKNMNESILVIYDVGNV